jgi:hypothetical protein
MAANSEGFPVDRNTLPSKKLIYLRGVAPAGGRSMKLMSFGPILKRH